MSATAAYGETLLMISCSQLSGDALGALQEFYTERDDRQRRFEELKRSAEERSSRKMLSMGRTPKVFSKDVPFLIQWKDAFGEDWNSSQFWVSARPIPSKELGSSM